jgi:hypothetical protein
LGLLALMMRILRTTVELPLLLPQIALTEGNKEDEATTLGLEF